MLQKASGESTLLKTLANGSGQPSTSSTKFNITKVKEMVTENRHLSLREIAAELSVSHVSIRTILNDCLDMKRVAARLVPKDHLTRLSL